MRKTENIYKLTLMHNKERETQKKIKKSKKCIDKHIFLIYNVFNKTKERKNVICYIKYIDITKNKVMTSNLYFKDHQ